MTSGVGAGPGIIGDGTGEEGGERAEETKGDDEVNIYFAVVHARE